MTVETATYIGSLNSALPTGADAKAEGDDHIRLLKSTLLATFPGMTGAMTGTHTQLNKLVSVFSIASAPANAVAVDAAGKASIPGAMTLTAATRYLKAQVGGATTWGAGAIEEMAVGFSGIRSVFEGGDSWSLVFTAGTSATFALGTQPERMRIDALGNITQNINPTAPVLSVNNTMVASLPSDTILRIAVRGSDGVTRIANIPLS